ncbi:hypothetical protein AD949_05720 [Acetobacter orleanensis]|nr:hypothetical protein AD949_05720 [Acetobacter orleanensis]
MRRALAVGIACLMGLVGSQNSWAASKPAPVPDQTAYQTLFNQLSAEPLRYGGLVSARNNRILVGLHPTGPGTVAGEMMRLDSAMRPLDAGPITGTLTPPTSTQLSHCHLKVTLSDRDILLDGPCSGNLLSGVLTSHPKPSQLWSQVTNFISPDTSVSQYWLSRDTWQAAITPSLAH